MSGFLFGVKVTRQRASKTADPYSAQNTQDDWEHPLTEDFEGCAVWQESSIEPVAVGSEIRNQLITFTKVTLPYSADVTSQDRLVVPGVGTIEVRGEIERWKQPMTGWEAGAVAVGVKIDG